MNESNKLSLRTAHPVTTVAAIGLIASAGWHLVAWTGRASMDSPAILILLGAFPLGFYVIQFMQDIVAESSAHNWLKTALIGAPVWIDKLLKGSFAYTVAMLIVLAAVLSEEQQLEAVYFSAGSATFYAGLFAILYARDERARLGFSSTCSNGHGVSPLARFCPSCGLVIVQPSLPSSRIN